MQVTLEDKYTQEKGQVFLTGVEALVRIPLMQQRLDRAAGLNTAGFISGYRGSPLGTYDLALNRAGRFLEAHDIRFLPGVNEELAATACLGAQQAPLLPGANRDGVFAIWYGKGPGVDRSGDALKHGNLAGSSAHGGVLVAAGDDHAAKSSTTAHQSEHALLAALIPVLYPASLQEYLACGLYGFALSRFSGLWVGFKCATEVVETSGTVLVDPPDIRRPQLELPEDGLNIRVAFNPLADERRVIEHRLPAAQAFARANGLDRAVLHGQRRELGIVTAGKSYTDTRKALAALGLSEERCAELGVGVYKLMLTWPVETGGLQDFANAYRRLVVIEEKRPLIEEQLRSALFNLPAARRPEVVGKTDLKGAPLLPSYGELSPGIIADVLARNLAELGVPLPDGAMHRCTLDDADVQAMVRDIVRTPAFCSGCPHNRSTAVPDGSLAMAGIGCHTMAIMMKDSRTLPPTQMGGEGANWIGAEAFTDTPHMFQNLGDGTYFHSGLLAIRAAVAAGSNITYKILYNDAVAMTGGQAVDGTLTVPDIARQVAAENVGRVVLVSDDPDRVYPGGLPDGLERRPRNDLVAIEKELREISGVTVLIYDQVCAAEKRRRRKRGTFPDPAKRMYINPMACEGCGDCSVQSNCVSIVPLETPFGRKRAVDQSSCNKDYSCAEGFCPSFVTVRGGGLRKRSDGDKAAEIDRRVADLPEPDRAGGDSAYHTLIGGIGGTGVVTTGALLGMAAHIEGRAANILDITGLSQKNGTVFSHVSIAADASELHSARIGAGEADLLLGCDLVVAGGAEALGTVARGRTRAVVNNSLVPTYAFQQSPDIDFRQRDFIRSIDSLLGDDAVAMIAASRIVSACLGDKVTANSFLLGYACQAGLLPVGIPALHAAMRLNGVSVEANLRAFGLGRLVQHEPSFADRFERPDEGTRQQTLDEILQRRVEWLTEYQDAAYAERYTDYVRQVASAERALAPGQSGLAEAVASNLAKLMAYKDEYEVARLLTSDTFRRQLDEQFDGDYTVSYNLAPPLIAARDPETGHGIKREFGPWLRPLLVLLQHLKFLRGTPLDLFGRTAERRNERRLIGEYRQAVDAAIAVLTPDSHELVVAIANLPEQIRGYGHVKERSIARARTSLADLQAKLAANTKGAPKSQVTADEPQEEPL